MANGRKTDQGRIVAVERRQQVLVLRKAGGSFRAIGRQLGVSEAQAHRDYKAVMTRLAAMELANADELRTMELLRLDELLLALNPGIKMGKVDAINAARQISESRRKLLGLDAPDQHLIAQFAYEVNIGEAEDAYAQPYIGDDAATPLLGE